MWRARPVFVSSTFRDMQAERDWLREHAFLDLADWLAERRHRLEVVDLRWGVPTGGEAAVHAKEALVLKVCLDEIERSRPFLIALLGHRYGWVPPAERMQAAIDERGFATAVAGKSVTALELEFGVLANPEQAARSFCYFRDEQSYDGMGAADLAPYREPADAAALEALKGRLKRSLPDHWRDYHLEWDAAAGEFTESSLQAFSDLVLNDLKAALAPETAAFLAAPPPTWQEAERRQRDEFISLRADGFVGRQALVAELLAFATSPAEGAAWGVCVTGEAGAGKSALFAHLAEALDRPDVLLLSHAAGAGGRSSSAETMLEVWIDQLGTVLGVADPLAGERVDLDEVFASLLGRAAIGRRVVLLLDALDQFDPTARGRHLTWLPRLWPPNARLLATAIPGEATTALEERAGTALRPLPPFDLAEAAAMARGLCGRYHRELEADVLAAVLARRRGNGPAAGNALWVQLAVESLNLLDADDFARADREFTGSAEERLHQLLLTTAEELPATVEGLYQAVFERAEKLHGEAATRELSRLLAVSRGGWRESDLRELLPTRTGEAWDPLRFAALRRCFRGQLVRRGEEVRWDFAHAQARVAARDRYLKDETTAREVHRAIADHLERLPADDPLHCGELMVHLIEADDQPRAARIVAGLVETPPLDAGREPHTTYRVGLVPAEQQGFLAEITQRLLADGGRDDGPGLTWLLGLLGQTEFGHPNITKLWTADSVRGQLCVAFRDLAAAVAQRVSLAVQRRLLEATEAELQRLATASPADELLQHNWSVALNHLGTLAFRHGEYAAARERFEACRAIRERLLAADPTHVDRLYHVGIVYERLGDLALAERRLPEAASWFTQRHAIVSRLCEHGPDDVRWQRDRAVAVEKLGDVAVATDHLDAAAGHFRESLALFERLAASDPTNAMWQRDVTMSMARLAEVLREQGQGAEAQRLQEAALELRERLTAGDPNDRQRQLDLVTSQMDLGDLAMGRGAVLEAWQRYSQSRNLAEQLVASDPDDPHWQPLLAAALGRVADVTEAFGDLSLQQGDPGSALTRFEECLALRERSLAIDPAEPIWQRELGVAHSRVGEVALTRDDLAAARTHFEAGFQAMAALTESHPDNPWWQYDFGVVNQRLAQLEARQGRVQEAHRHAALHHEIVCRLVPLDPTNETWRRDLLAAERDLDLLDRHLQALAAPAPAASAEPQPSGAAASPDAEPAAPPSLTAALNERLREGDAQLDQGRASAALGLFQRALTLAQRAARKEPGELRGVLLVRWRLGDAHVALGQPGAAVTELTAAARLAEQLAAGGDRPAQLDLAETLASLAEATTAAAGARAAREPWVRCREILRAVVAAGAPLDEAMAERLAQAEAALAPRRGWWPFGRR